MKIESIAVSTKKGTQKVTRQVAEVQTDHGIIGDAHAGDWHRQVSFLAMESIDKAKAQGVDVSFGSYAENIATSGIDWPLVPVGTRLTLGETVVVEITQIGKECHRKCAIYHQAGDCIMPKEGVFGRVINSGTIHVGDPIHFLSSQKETDGTGKAH